MKKLVLSLAAAPLIMSAVASADVDVKVSGQAVVYYQTADGYDNDAGIFDKSNSRADAGLQLNAAADLGNGFSAGGTINFLSTLGLDGVVVNNVMMGRTSTEDAYVSQLFVAKTVGKTTLKLGRQELPKSLSPFAFSEGWNVFKNTFDAALVINTDIPNTTLVGAYVANSNAGFTGDVTSYDSLMAAGALPVTGNAYMLTADTSAIPFVGLTGSYYHLSQIKDPTATVGLGSAEAWWVDARIGHGKMPAGLYVDVQGGMIMPDIAGTKDTTAMGAKIGAKLGGFGLVAAVTDVDDGTVGIRNVGTNIKTPLYTQMVLNQNFIANDNTTFMLYGDYSFGDAGKLIVRDAYTDGGTTNVRPDKTYNELDIMYKVKSGGVNYFAAYVNQVAEDIDNAMYENKNSDMNHFVRVWARYNF